MKKIYTLLSALILINANAQLCTRYYDNVFSTVTNSTGIQYGSNVTWNNSGNINLLLDFYQPSNDVATKRPLIIFAHGGSFLAGTRTDPDQVALCNAFAKKGYATATIDYRTGFFPLDSARIVPALVRAVHDMKAAIRFFYKDAQTANLYKIDTNQIFIGGTSAGAITALHVAYLDNQCEMEPFMSTTIMNGLGGLNGNSGNPGYSSKVKGVINLCGALGRFWWMKAGDPPLCSMHGTADATVLYGRGKANPGFQTLYLDGSRMLFAGTQVNTVPHKFYTWYGAPHVPFVGSNASNIAYMDSTVNFVRDFLLPYVNCSNTPTLLPNTPSGNVTTYSYVPCVTTAIKENKNSISADLYPNPSNGYFSLQFNEYNTYKVEVLNLQGKTIYVNETTGDFLKLNVNASSGIYLLRITANNKDIKLMKILVE